MSPVSVSADDFNVTVTRSVQAKGVQIPYVLFVRLSEVDETRMGISTRLDLRHLQKNVPGLFSGILKETCKVKFALAMKDAHAEGEAIVGNGQVQAKIFLCNEKDPKVHYRGPLLLGQNVNFQVRASAKVRGQCLVLNLEDVQLDPLGFLGGLADLFNLTETARELILQKGTEVLDENPICPELPDELSALAPRFHSGGTHEIGESGLGATLSGSIDTSATTLIELLRLAQLKQQGATK